MNMLSCKGASTLSSEKLDRNLTFRERMALGMHLFVCRMCRRYKNQINFLRVASRRFDERSPDSHRLTEEAKARMRERLKNP